MTWRWTDEETQRVAALRQQGFSASEIAERIGCGVTRNAVIGRLYRLGVTREKGLPTLAKPRMHEPEPREKRKPKPREPRAKPAPRKEPIVPVTIRRPPITNDESAAVTHKVLALQAGQCRFPVGDLADADFHFCGAPQRDGASYCEAHERLTRAPIEVSRKANRRAEKQARMAA